MEEPQAYFKTVNNGLEKYGTDLQKKIDLDIEEVGSGIQQRKSSMIAWVNPQNPSENKNKDAINSKKRPSSSVSSSGAAGGKRSERSNADTTTLATQGVTLTDI